jgi:dTDP-4-amino-4,6-dideoxygalactose transaminase
LVVIVPSFTYVAIAEVIGLLRLNPVMVEVDEHTFNITLEIIEKAITPQTKAIVPVYPFGQYSDMEAIMTLAKKNNIFVVEDITQTIGLDYKFSHSTTKKVRTIADIKTT